MLGKSLDFKRYVIKGTEVNTSVFVIKTTTIITHKHPLKTENSKFQVIT